MFDRTPVPQLVARKIQELILSGELAAGCRIPSQRLFSEQLGVSRASLREALLTLETLGLIRTAPGRGTFVTDDAKSSSNNLSTWRYSDSYTVLEVYQTRLMLEGTIASLAARNVTSSHLLAMENATNDMEKAWESHDLLSTVEADLLFHETITNACGNSMLQALYNTMRNQLNETQRQPIPNTGPDRMIVSISEHRALIHEMKKGNAEGSKTVMEAHIRNTAVYADIRL